MQFITITDVILLPIYLMIVLVICILHNRLFCKKEDRKYYYKALGLKLFGAIMTGLIYQFVYGGGDTANYFDGGKGIADLLFTDFDKWLLFMGSKNGELLVSTVNFHVFQDAPSFLIQKIVSVINVFTFSTYLNSCLFFALFSFWCFWALFNTLNTIYPPAYKTFFAISLFFIPSVFFWGSGIFKDTICIAGLTLFFSAFLRLFYLKQYHKVIRLTIMIAASVMLMVLIKMYIFICLIFSLLIIAMLKSFSLFRNSLLNVLSSIFLLGFLLLSLYFSRDYLTGMLAEYSVEQFTSAAKTTYEYIQSVSAETDGSGYDLGKIDYTDPLSLLRTLPNALNVTLFRPYVWESKNALMLISSLESLIFLLLTIYLLLKTGIRNFFRILFTNKIMWFFLLLALLFAVAVGFSTGNFGTLVRYKIPCMPFYLLCILFILKNHQLSKVAKKLTV